MKTLRINTLKDFTNAITELNNIEGLKISFTNTIAGQTTLEDALWNGEFEITINYNSYSIQKFELHFNNNIFGNIKIFEGYFNCAAMNTELPYRIESNMTINREG